MNDSSPAARPTISPRSSPASVSASDVVGRQQQAAQRLAAHPGGQDAIHLAHLRADHLGVAPRQPGVDHRDQPRPVAQQVERHHRRDHHQGQHVEQREAAADQPRQRAGDEGQHRPRLAADQVAQLVVHHVGAEASCRRTISWFAQPCSAATYCGTRLNRMPDLGEDQRIQQQREQQHGGDQRQQHQQRRDAARQAKPGELRGRRVEHVGDTGGGTNGSSTEANSCSTSQLTTTSPTASRMRWRACPAAAGAAPTAARRTARPAGPEKPGGRSGRWSGRRQRVRSGRRRTGGGSVRREGTRGG